MIDDFQEAGSVQRQFGLNELRQMYLDFFKGKGHLILKSFSLIPHNDKSLLLINSGMAPLKPYFTKQEIPPSNRIATCQKCIRTGDIDIVGKTDRHGTFFEMLGNFSFGDYFKKEAIAWSWEFLTEVIGLDKTRLYPSVYVEDDEAFNIWNQDMGISKERIFKLGKEDNFWEHGAGPCGPCSEIYYDRGKKYGCDRPDCTVGCDCDRYVEVWNNVFTQFESDGKGHYEPLKSTNIDTGMGLERLSMVVQDVDSIFDVDTIKALRKSVCDLANVNYKEDSNQDISIRLITDHIRSVTFMVSDGILPANEGREYVLRRLLRRAARHGRLLGIKGKFLTGLSHKVIELSKDGYPELEEKKDFIFKVIEEEEERFNKTLDQGLTILMTIKGKLVKERQSILPGQDAFKLYDTYGFPLDLTEEILSESNITIDKDGFEKAMNKQRDIGRTSRKSTNYMGADENVYQQIDPSISSVFVGYEYTSYTSAITVMTSKTRIQDVLSCGEEGTIFVKETPFYATSGGQEADTGIIASGESQFIVKDTIKLMGGKIGHVGVVTKGQFRTDDTVTLTIDRIQRSATAKNHSATHLLQKALKTVLGAHIEQAGSSVSNERLRFDFTHFSPLTPAEIAQIEQLVNQQISDNLKVLTKVMDLEDAKKIGAIALFGEKYDQQVRVVTMGDFSKELCGGTHVSNTGAIGAFKIISETGIAAGVRRIEALTSDKVLDFYQNIEKQLNMAAKLAKTEPSLLSKRIERFQEEIKALTSENEKLKSRLAKDSVSEMMNNVTEVKGVKLLAARVSDVDMNGLMDLGDQLKAKLHEGVIILISSAGDSKVSLLSMATQEAIDQGAHAGNLIKEIARFVGGGGGGRPSMAQAGGKNPAGIDEALKSAPVVLAGQLK